MNQFKGFIQSFKNSFNGIAICIKRERNFRLYLTLIVYAFILAIIFKFQKYEFAILFVAAGSLLSSECLNTGIETGVDFAVRKKQHPMIKAAKDTASAGVFIPAMSALAAAIMLFWKPNEWSLLFTNLKSSPINIFLIIIALAFLVWFPFMFGKQKKTFYKNQYQSNNEIE